MALRHLLVLMVRQDEVLRCHHQMVVWALTQR